MDEFIEVIEDQIKTGFYVTKIPKGIFKEFKKLCKENYGDIYWVGISELLKIKKRYDEMSAIFSSLQKQIDELKNQNHKKIKTFGGE